MRQKLYLVGGGGHCCSCIDVVEEEGRYDIGGIVDIPEKIGKTLLSYPIIASDEDLDDLVADDSFFLITVGQIKSSLLRKNLYKKLSSIGAFMPIIISPRAHVSKHAAIGKGTIVMHDALVNARAKVGVNCIINTKALIEHDAIVGDHCHVSTAAVINGEVHVGSDSFVGSNAVTVQRASIPPSSFVRAGKLERGV